MDVKDIDVTESEEEDNERKELTVQSNWLEIKGHLLRFKGKLIQISNITAVTYWIAKTPPKPKVSEMIAEGHKRIQRGKEDRNKARIAKVLIGFFGIVFLLAGVAAFFAEWLLGLFMIVIGMAMLCVDYLVIDRLIQDGNRLIAEGQSLIDDADRQTALWNQQCDEAKKNKHLNIYTNSGWKYDIPFKNADFLMKVYNVLANVFANGGKADKVYNIDISGCEFKNSSVVDDEHTEYNYG